MESGSGGWPGGQACLPAVQMALEDVNLDFGLLPNYALRLHHNNSKCSQGLAARQLFELLYNEPTKLILLAGCSPVTTMVAEAAPVWNLLVLSYGASSPALSNRERFPTLFRTHPSANMQNPTRVHLFERFKWKRITILQSAEEVFDSTAKDLEEQCRESGIKVERQSFYGDPKDALKAIRRQDARIIVGLFYATEARRVICQAYHYGLYGHKFVWFMIGWYADTWFIPHPDESLNCTRKNMEKAVQYHFTTESIMLSRDTLPTISGMTGSQFLKRLRRRITTDPQETGGWPEAPLAYDAIWALALMLNCTLGTLSKGLQQFNYNNTFIAKRMFECMKNIQFRGVSGQVMFSDLGDRIARTQIEQMQDGKYVLLGYYDSSTQTLEWKNKEKFIGTIGPPSDSTRIKQWPIGVDYRFYLVCMNIMVISLVFCSSLLFFNQRYANRRPIIQSQRQCNNLLIIGSALCLFSLAFIGYPGINDNSNNNDGELLALLGKENKLNSKSPFLFSTFCHAKLLLLMFGFSLAYGSLFAKVWVAHKLGAIQKNKQITASNNNEESSDNGIKLINNLKQSIPPTPWDSIRTIITAITNRQVIVVNALRKISQHSYGNLSSTSIGSKSPIFNRKNNINIISSTTINLLNLPITPSHFYPIIVIIFLIDLTISLFWFCLDPMKQQKIHFQLQEPPIGTDLDIMLLPVLELCQSQNHDIWIAIILSYKGLLLLLGIFLAYDTKNLKVKYINDLNSTLLSICNVGILCLLCGTIVIFFLRTQPNPFFCFISATVYVCTFVSMGLIFGPKIKYIYKNPNPTKEEEEDEQLQKQQNNTFNDLTINQAEQNRYQQLLKENIELKRQIEMRNIRIQECKRILENQLILNSPRFKTHKKYILPNKINNNKSSNEYSNNTNSNSNCLPTTSSGINGEILLELEQTTISSILEPTMITILDQQQELLTIELEQQNNNNNIIYNNNQEEEPFIENNKEKQLFNIKGIDTGVCCSDYDDDEEENCLNKKDNNNLSSESLNKNESEDEIFL